MVEITAKFSRILGHLFFDGSVREKKTKRYQVNYSNASIHSVKNFIKLIKSSFDLNPSKIHKYSGKNGKYYQVSVYYKKFVNNL